MLQYLLDGAVVRIERSDICSVLHNACLIDKLTKETNIVNVAAKNTPKVSSRFSCYIYYHLFLFMACLSLKET